MRTVADRSRRIWALSGLITLAALAVPGANFVATAGDANNPPSGTPISVTRTVTVPQPVTSVTVLSYGGPVQVTAGPVRRVQGTETSSAPPGTGPVPVTQSVAGGRLVLADPACSSSAPFCSVSFTLVVPSGVTVTAVTDGGQLTVSGVAGADLDSGGGLVRATRIAGPLTVRTSGGPLLIDGLTGPLDADTSSGPVTARGLGSATAIITTDGGNAQIAFTAAPDSLTVSTDGGLATLTVPGGPYALTADTNGGPESVGIPTDPAARRLITVSTGSGPLQIGPPASG
ncbi:MAG: hypothetical protein ACRDOB_18405 [Streptosporangiaceae bacterium]